MIWALMHMQAQASIHIHTDARVYTVQNTNTDVHVDTSQDINTDAYVNIGQDIEAAGHVETGQDINANAHVDTGQDIDKDVHVDTGYDLDTNTHVNTVEIFVKLPISIAGVCIGFSTQTKKQPKTFNLSISTLHESNPSTCTIIYTVMV